MALRVSDVGGPGPGLWFKEETCYATNRTGATLAIGDLVMFDQGDTDAGTTTSLAFANAGSVLANVINPPATIAAGDGNLSGTGVLAPFFFGVVVGLDTSAATPGGDDTIVKLQVSGVVDCKTVGSGTSSITVGMALCPALSGVLVRALSPVVGVGQRIIAIAWEPNGTGTGPYQVVFDGINGFSSSFAN